MWWNDYKKLVKENAELKITCQTLAQLGQIVLDENIKTLEANKETITKYTQQVADAMQEMEKMRAMARTLTEHTWIPVGERLPECGEYVLINANGATFIAYHILSVQQWSAAEGVYFCRDAYKSVTHWMPLPEPPEVKE